MLEIHGRKLSHGGMSQDDDFQSFSPFFKIWNDVRLSCFSSSLPLDDIFGQAAISSPFKMSDCGDVNLVLFNKMHNICLYLLSYPNTVLYFRFTQLQSIRKANYFLHFFFKTEILNFFFFFGCNPKPAVPHDQQSMKKMRGKKSYSSTKFISMNSCERACFNISIWSSGISQKSFLFNFSFFPFHLFSQLSGTPQGPKLHCDLG